MTRLVRLMLFCFITGCVSKTNIPKDVIPKDKMQQVLWDLIQADQYSRLYLAKDSSNKNVSLETMQLYDEVFQIHHISINDFKKSYQFYLGRPDIFKVVLDSLSARGTRHMNDLYNSSIPAVPPKHPPVTLVK